MSDVKLLSPRNVAKILGFKPRTVTRWCKEGEFPTARKIGRVWRIREDDETLVMMLKINKIAGVDLGRH